MKTKWLLYYVLTTLMDKSKGISPQKFIVNMHKCDSEMSLLTLFYWYCSKNYTDKFKSLRFRFYAFLFLEFSSPPGKPLILHIQFKPPISTPTTSRFLSPFHTYILWFFFTPAIQ